MCHHHLFSLYIVHVGNQLQPVYSIVGFLPWSPPGPSFMALLTVSTESALTEAGNSVLSASVFHGLAANFGFCAWVLPVYKASAEIWRLHVSGEL